MLLSQSRLLLHKGYDETRFVIGWTPVLQLIAKFYVTPHKIIQLCSILDREMSTFSYHAKRKYSTAREQLSNYSRIFPNICEYFWLFLNTLEYFATFWNILEYSKIKWNNNYLEYSIISWSILEYSKIFQNIPEYSRIFPLESCSRPVLVGLSYM